MEMEKWLDLVLLLDQVGQGNQLILILWDFDLFSFLDREEAEKYFNEDPYVTGKVWEGYTLEPFRLANID